MKSLVKVFLVVLALLVGVALADEHEAGNEAAAEGKAAETAVEGQPATAEEEQSAEAEEAGVPKADTDGDLVVSHDEADAAFEQLAAQVAGSEFTHSDELAEFLASRDDTSLFLLLLQQTDLAEAIANAERPLTIFVPSDTAFSQLDRLQFSMLIDDPVALQDMLERHVVLEPVRTADLAARLDGEGQVAGGGAGDMTAEAGDEDGQPEVATAPGFVRLETMAGADLEVGTGPASERRAAMADEGGEAAAVADVEGEGEVAGGGAAQAAPAGPFVGDAQIVDPDLESGDVTIHVIDAVLLPPMEESEPQ